MRFQFACAVLFAVSLGTCTPPPAMAQVANFGVKRVALVIGNSSYKDGPLKNPANDAGAMTSKLRQLGFQVIERQNATKTQMEMAIVDFGEALSSGAVGLFYYAGHGLQVNGRNFLVPVDAAITSEQRVRLQSVDVDAVLEQMDGAKSGINLVILDACRNNPFERRFRSAGGGLAQIFAPQGTLIAYATAPGKVAADGDGPNGIYTSRLLQHIDVPGVTVEEVFKRVRIDVARETNGVQTPWESSSLTGSFFFTEASKPTLTTDKEMLFWQSVKDSDEPAMLEVYLGQFPNGTFAALARVKLAVLDRKRQEVLHQQTQQQVASGPTATSEPVATVAPVVAPSSVQLAAAPAPGSPRSTTTDGIDGTWRGSIACGASTRAWSGAAPFSTYEYQFEAIGGKLVARGSDGDIQGTMVANGSVNLSGTRINMAGKTAMLSFKGKEENGRFTANGRWGDRDCTLAYVKNK